MSAVQKRMLAAAFIMVLVFSILAFGEKTLSTLKIIFESGYLTILLWTYVVSSISMHAFIVVRTRNDAYDFFEKYSNTIYSVFTYGIGGSTSIALAKGLFLQYFYSIEFFKGFGVIDIGSMFILASFLLIYSILNSTRLLFESIFYSSASAVSAANYDENITSRQ